MYVNYFYDRKSLGYQAVKDQECGTALMIIIDSSFLFIYDFSSNVKGRAQRRIIIIYFILVVTFGLSLSSEAVGLSPLPRSENPIERVQASYRRQPKVEAAKFVPKKQSRIFFRPPEKIIVLVYLSDPKFASDQRILELLHELRGGNFPLSGTVAALLIGVIFLAISQSEAFSILVGNRNGNREVPVPPPIEFQRPNPHLVSSHPPIFDLFKKGGKRHPSGSQLTAHSNPQSSSVPTAARTQASGFVKHGKIDLVAAHKEVERRATELGCENFKCDLSRFTALATEDNQVSETSIREAITVLNGEMYGYYKNARRQNYGKGVRGLDFLVDGTGPFSQITHADVKNPVGTAIAKANNNPAPLKDQIESMMKKALRQKKKWANPSSPARINVQSRVPAGISFPQSSANTLSVVDCFDVPAAEKGVVNNVINQKLQTDPNIVVLNNVTNI